MQFIFAAMTAAAVLLTVCSVLAVAVKSTTASKIEVCVFCCVMMCGECGEGGGCGSVCLLSVQHADVFAWRREGRENHRRRR